MTAGRRNRKFTEGLNVCIVGGSIAACALAPLLLRAGCKVSVFERSTGNLEDRGVGLTMKISTLDALAALDLIDDDMGRVPVWRRTFARPHGDHPAGDGPWDVFWEQPVALHANHWGVLYRSLRKRVPDEIYHQGHEVTDLNETPAGSIELRLAHGPTHVFDLVVFADGYDSFGRRMLHPDAGIQPVRYLLWRGMIDEWVLPMPGGYEDAITFFGYIYGHGFIYFVPSPVHGAAAGKRRLNWAFQETIADKDIPGIKPDENGYVWSGLRPGAATDRQVAYCRDMARRHFPPYFGDIVEATAQPFVQPIFEACVPRYTRGGSV